MRTSELVMELVDLLERRDRLDEKITKVRAKLKKAMKAEGVSKSERAGTGDPGQTS